MSLINLTPEYNLLEFEDYEKNDLVIGVIDDLKLFFQSSPCRCEKTKKDPHCFEKIGFKNFFERHFEFSSSAVKMLLDIIININTMKIYKFVNLCF